MKAPVPVARALALALLLWLLVVGYWSSHALDALRGRRIIIGSSSIVSVIV